VRGQLLHVRAVRAVQPEGRARRATDGRSDPVVRGAVAGNPLPVNGLDLIAEPARPGLLHAVPRSPSGLWWTTAHGEGSAVPISVPSSFPRSMQISD
jgi:hypothetical protein